MLKVPVQYVLDGDTIQVDYFNLPVRVRMIGINAPEVANYGRKSQRGGNVAKKFVQDKVSASGDAVYLAFDRMKIDKYNRALCYVYLDDNVMLNATLVSKGLAIAVDVPPNSKYRDYFAKLQREAKANKRGLWAG